MYDLKRRLENLDEESQIDLFKSGLVFDLLDIAEQDQILDFFYNVTSYKVLDTIAIFLSDSEQDKALEAIIKVIEKHRGGAHLSTLIYACSEFDCTKYASFFVDLVITENAQSCMEAIGVIDDMKGPISVELYDELKMRLIAAENDSYESERSRCLMLALDRLENLTV